MKNLLATITLTDKVEEYFMQYIKDNKLVPGDSIRNEKQFVEILRVGRNVVKEAISRFRMLGIVESRTKRGVIIREPPLLSGLKKF